MIAFLTHFVATVFMTGLVWMVQAVHYPLFREVGADAFPRYQAQHMRRITWVVAPAMLVELASAVWLWREPPPGASASWLLANLALLGAIWASTALLQVPAHERLRRGFDAAAHRRLVETNWIRTALWSARTGLLVVLGYTAMRPI